MYSTEANRLRSIESQIADGQKLSWVMLFVGLFVGFVGMHFFVNRPTSNELKEVRRELAAVESRMNELAGMSELSWETNDLLSSLKAQQVQLEDARTALQSVRHLRMELQAEAERSKAALAAVGEMAEVQGQILSQRPRIDQARQAALKADSLYGQLIAQAARSADAVDALAHLDELREVTLMQAGKVKDLSEVACGQMADLVIIEQEIDDIARLTRRVETAPVDILKAERNLDGLLALQNELINEGDRVYTARDVSENLISMQRDIVSIAPSVPTARDIADRLVDLQSMLQLDETDVATSQQNLADLMELSTTINDEAESIGRSVEALELLSAFREELQVQIFALTGMRRDLTEIAMLGTTVDNVMSMIDPLVQLGNLSRLSNVEVREAARVILESRSSRLSQRLENGSSRESAGPADASQVHRELSNGPVPTPVDLDVTE